MQTMSFACARDNFSKISEKSRKLRFLRSATKADKSQISSVGCFVSLLDQYEIVCTLIS